MGQIRVQVTPQALQRRVDLKGRTYLVNALRSVGSIPIPIKPAEFVATQTAIEGKLSSILSAATDKIWADFGCKVRFVGALDGGEGGVDLEHLAYRHQTLHLSAPADISGLEAAMDGGLNQNTDFDFVRGC